MCANLSNYEKFVKPMSQMKFIGKATPIQA